MPPLAVLAQGQDLKVINGQGAEQRELTDLTTEQIFGVSAQQAATQGFGITAEEAGPNLVLFDGAISNATEVAVLSHAGTVMGTASIPSATNGFYVSPPDGAEWAWSVDQGADATGEHGVIEVGGLGEPARTVYQWSVPANATEQLNGWYSTGIIVHRFEYSGSSDDPTDAWFALKPNTGTVQELFSGNEQYLLARNGDTAAALINDPDAVLISGVQYAESDPLVGNADPADISPDGSYVAVSRTNPSGDSIELVTVANQTHIDLPSLMDYGWWTDNEILAQTAGGDIWIYTVEGQPVNEIHAANLGWSYHGAMLG